MAAFKAGDKAYIVESNRIIGINKKARLVIAY